jgi:predicted  nucleic acid-binding Zn-ribbon protein
MPDFNEQLETIARLRAEARQHEEALYAARVSLQKVNQRMGRAERQQTIAVADRDREVAEMRAQMAKLAGQLAALREEDREIARQLDQISEQRRLLAHLKQTLAAARNRAEALRRQLAELQRQDPPPSDEIKRLQAELAQVEQAQTQLDEAIRAATERLAEESRRERELRGRQSALQTQMDGVRDDLRGIQGRLVEQLQPAFDDPAAIKANAAALEAAATRSRSDSIRVNGELISAIGGMYAADPHPRTPLARLNDQIPFVLFPVRLETIFAPVASQQGGAGTELRVRVYPDDIVVHTHEATLTDREVDAGQLYWVELVVAAHLRSERERRQAAAWRHLVDLFGGQRAAWVAQNTKPSDWEALSSAGEMQSLIAFARAADANFFTALSALPLTKAVRATLAKAVADDDGDLFIRLAEEQSWGDRVNAAARTRIVGFPAIDLTKTDAWSRAPRTRVLPDRFILLLYPTETSAPREIAGAIIPDTVFLGPDPLDPKDTLVQKNGALTLGGACEWMSDFNAAVAQGMGFRVPLSEQEARDGFARVVVLGLRLSASADHGAAMLEELIANHQFSPKGFSLVPQGTPTNNTERDGAGYSDNDPYDDLAFFTELDAPAFDPGASDALKSQTDGRALADALGIGYPALQTVQHADQTDILEARAMNTALFPSTLGYWLKNWMAPVVTPDAARLTRTFFTQHVTGRGPLPAIRVGNQPYGVLVTSDMSRWKYPPTSSGPFATFAIFDELTPFLTALHGILLRLEKHWTGLAADAAYVGKPGSDSSDILMNLLGLHPTSVEFFQRVGFHEEYLSALSSFMARRSYANELASLIKSAPASVRLYFRTLGIEEDIGTVAHMLAMHVLWQHYTTELDAPNLVENKPPSEVNTLAFNYIDWLAKAADAGTIINEPFSGAKPTALLYAMLRNALLLQLHHGAYDWLKQRSDFDSALEQSLRATVLPGVRGSAPRLSRFELMAVLVEAAQPDHPAPGTRVADWIWRGPTPAESEAAFVQAQRAALGQLAPASTARLERCLVEHLDCCQYRLDAWETGLFAQRLQAQRHGGSAQQDRQTGAYLGAFGWVEHVKATPKTFLRPEDLPPTLRPADQEPILEEDEVGTATRAAGASKQGGYTHAPSLNHAAAAALLRNAYLSHASSAQAGMLSNNLSSERVRRAQFVLEGMRNGQPIEALLGYQFERGLHDRTSQSAARGDVPVLELNEFIQPYREAFPFESREIPQAGTGAASETVPPYSVVNGLTLTTAAPGAANGYGLAAVLPAAQWPGAVQGAAVLAERDALLDTLDAVKDLLMAENAYQLVQGNFDRVAAVSLAQKDARIPPSLEVLNTPRGTQFTFTNRVTLHFDDLDPAVAASNPWPAMAMTPRAIAEPGMNFWLGGVLGRAPEDVGCVAYHIAADDLETPLEAHPVTLADLEIQPVDFIALTGINTADTQGGAELETRIAFFYRRTHGIAMDQAVRIDFDPPAPAGALTFGQLFPLARRLRALIGECRTLDAQDFLPAAGGKATTVSVDASNPSGCDAAELRARAQSALAALTALADALDGPAAPTVNLILLHDPETAVDDEPFAGALGDAFAKLEQVGADFADPKAVSVTFPLLDAEALAATLRAVALFGLSDAFPPESDFTADGARLALFSRARRVARRLRQAEPKDGLIDRAAAFLAAAGPDKSVADQVAHLRQAGQTLFADTLKFVPAFICYNEVDLTTADGARAQLLSHAVSRAPGLTASVIIDEWLQGLARVRPRMHTWEVVRALADALNDAPLEMRPAQVPHRDQDSWLAVEFPAQDPLDATKPFGISRDTLSIVAHGGSAFQAGVPQRGLLLDEWTEEIPTARENTGISFRFNQPNAAPPQTLLLAVTPEETGSWNWDDLVGTLNDTLDRAKRRAVEPAQLEKDGLIWNALAPALVSEFSALAAADVSLDLMGILQYIPLDKFYTRKT